MKLEMVVIGVTLLAAACGGGPKRESAEMPAPIRAVVTKARAVEVPQDVELVGTVEADRVAGVSSRVMATVTAVKVHAGDEAAAGQVLVEIDPRTALGQEAQAQGALAQARAALALTERNYERFKALLEENAASQLELDTARMQYEQAQGAVKQAEGAVESATSVARESTVVAPFAGRVMAKLVEVGDLAAPGRPLVTLESKTGRRLALAVPETIAAGLAVGQPIEVAIDALPGLGRMTAAIVEMTPGADPASHTFTVKAELPGPPVASGLAGRGWIASGTRRAVAVPAASVLERGGLSLVVIRDSDGRARSRAVTLGAPLSADTVEVLSGLTGDEDVLVGLGAVPTDGAPVEAAS
jgi:membrane fusion protein, multidrug efflux system